MKPVRVFLGAVPAMIDSIIRDVLSESRDIEIVSPGESDTSLEYDVLVLNDPAGSAHQAAGGDSRGRTGIVMVGFQGRQASVFHRIGHEFRLDGPIRPALEEAILMAAEGN